MLVLWVLLALTFTVSALALWVSQSTDLAVDQSNEIRAQSDRFATRETLKFLLATRPSRASGLYLGSEPRQLARTFQANPFVNMRARGSSSDLHYDGSKYRGLGETYLCDSGRSRPDRREFVRRRRSRSRARAARGSRFQSGIDWFSGCSNTRITCPTRPVMPSTGRRTGHRRRRAICFPNWKCAGFSSGGLLIRRGMYSAC